MTIRWQRTMILPIALILLIVFIMGCNKPPRGRGNRGRAGATAGGSDVVNAALATYVPPGIWTNTTCSILAGTVVRSLLLVSHPCVTSAPFPCSHPIPAQGTVSTMKLKRCWVNTVGAIPTIPASRKPMASMMGDGCLSMTTQMEE